MEEDDEEEQIDEAEVGQDVGDENCAQTNEPCKRSSSQRYKDRIVTMRQQSKETYQRENMAYMIGPSYFTQVENTSKVID